MSKYFKVRKLKEGELLVNLKETNKRKPGDFLKVIYVSRENSKIDLMVGYEFNKKGFSECRQSKLVRETREPTLQEYDLYKQGKFNIHEKDIRRT